MKPIHTALVTPEQEQATRELAAELGIAMVDFTQDSRDCVVLNDSLSKAEARELTRIAHSMDITVRHLVRGILRGFLKRRREAVRQAA
jgi:hypothetical protein